ncbi:MerR family transcriptional regulator [Streptacidiphilus monticola]|uniref:MerR family transcriptional regulator n=1 Tax=Streptacidiphilus monticola TaxID=2161674 RepID=A0ABW1FTU3_9ACTN
MDDDGLLTIGAFARLSRLSPKALRLYDELELLRPARVDRWSGYRHYAPEQLPQARLVSWLRQLGMPLARIREVVRLPPTAAAAEVMVFWAEQERSHLHRRDLADALLDELTGRETAMSAHESTVRWAALSDTGLVRQANQDTAYAGPGLLAVADGYGPDGGAAGSAVVSALREAVASAGDEGLPAALAGAVARAGATVAELPDSGTTVTALAWRGAQLALAHLGDSRAYLLRDGQLFRITEDHSYVQSLVAEGRLTPEEAEVHPQRALLLRALDGSSGTRAELSLRRSEPGDRYLLASDGLAAVAAEEAIGRVLAAASEPDGAVRELVALARAEGGPDNIAVAAAFVAA